MALWIKARGGKNLPDELLLSKYLDTGELSYLGTLYSRYMDLVYGVCLKYLNDRSGSQDAVMEIFEKLVTELTKREVISFKSWLYVVTRNHCLMAIRAGKVDVRNTRSLDDVAEVFMENDSELHPLDDDKWNNDKALEDCISKLKREQKESVRLFYYENLCYRDIAEKMNLDEKKVKSYLQNAKRNLKICLEGKDD